MTAPPVLQPRQNNSLVILPSTGSSVNVVSALPLGVYSNSISFISGAVDQVAFTYAMLAGDVLDIELTDRIVYAAYEISVLEYSYIVNLHQSKNALSSFLGSPTGSFNELGQITTGSLSGSNAALKFPRFSLPLERNVSDEIAFESGIGGTSGYYSSSVDITDGQQDYDLQKIILTKSVGDPVLNTALSAANNQMIRVTRVYYKSPSQIWRFFGYYGGLTVVGNLNTYGQYADDSTFDVIPAWQNKLQAINYETNLYTRASHYSYEIHNTTLRLFPVPTIGGPAHFWFNFVFAPDPIAEDPNARTGRSGVNNLNTLPFENIPYESINSIGKQWIRRYCVAICKGILSHARGKFLELPIPGNSVTLNHDTLMQQSTDEMKSLRDELKEILDNLTYQKIVEVDANIVENNSKVHAAIPKSIYVG